MAEELRAEEKVVAGMRTPRAGTPRVGTPGGKPSGEDDVAQPRVKNTVQEAKKVFGLHSTVGNRAVLLQELDDN